MLSHVIWQSAESHRASNGQVHYMAQITWPDDPRQHRLWDDDDVTIVMAVISIYLVSVTHCAGGCAICMQADTRQRC